jgi:hypothetical protein
MLRKTFGISFIRQGPTKINALIIVVVIVIRNLVWPSVLVVRCLRNGERKRM